MKKLNRIISLILVFAICISCFGLAGCSDVEKDDECNRHRDRDDDGRCDKCDDRIECNSHRDRDDDGRCDKCNDRIERDDSDDVCEHVDLDGNGKCDKCLKAAETNEQDTPKGDDNNGSNDPEGGENAGTNDPADDPEAKYFTVTFTDSDGSIIATQSVKEGELVCRPDTPEKYGYIFVCWRFEGRRWNFENDIPTDNITLLAEWKADPSVLSNVEYDGDVIYVGNTAATTGAMATIGVPFNLGIEAAFAVYNNNGGFNGKKVALKHYDDMGDSAQAVTLMEKLIFEDEIFAVVGNYGTYAVEANLDILKENCIPMVYAASGVASLFNSNATSDGDRCIFPVQPLNAAEGQVLILRAFAPAFDGDKYLGGLGGTKVGVISSSDEASQAMVEGIKLEAKNSGLTNIVYQNVTTDDFSAAASALQAEGCDVVIITVTGNSFVSALTALANVNYNKSVLTTYNNSNSNIFNDKNYKMTETGLNIFSKMTIFAHNWLDVNDSAYYFKDTSSALYKSYGVLGMIAKDENGNELGVPGFSKQYWNAALDIFNYAASQGRQDAFPMSYNSYTLAGYIAGNLFCQVLEAMEAEGKELTRLNFVETLESDKFTPPMIGELSYADGVRAGVQSFYLIAFFDTATLPEGATDYHCASSATICPLTSIDEFRYCFAK